MQIGNKYFDEINPEDRNSDLNALLISRPSFFQQNSRIFLMISCLLKQVLNLPVVKRELLRNKNFDRNSSQKSSRLYVHDDDLVQILKFKHGMATV